MSAWRPIEFAPKGQSVLLKVEGTVVPVYVGRQRYGQLGEPQQDEFAWRCDSSGRYAHPTHFALIPD